MDFYLDEHTSMDLLINNALMNEKDADFYFYKSIHRVSKWKAWGRVDATSKNLEAFFLATQIMIACHSEISMEYILDCLYLSSGYVCFHRGISGSSFVNIDTPKKVLVKSGSAGRMNEQFNYIKQTGTEPQQSSISHVKYFRHVLELSSTAKPPFKVWFPTLDFQENGVSRPGSPESIASMGECSDPIEIFSDSLAMCAKKVNPKLSSFRDTKEFLKNGGEIVYIDLVGSWTNLKLGSPLLKKFLEDAEQKFPGVPVVLQPLHPGLVSFYRKFGFYTMGEHLELLEKINIGRRRSNSLDSVIIVSDDELELVPRKSSIPSIEQAVSSLTSIPWPFQKSVPTQLPQQIELPPHRRGRKRKITLDTGDTPVDEIPLDPLSFMFPPTSVVFYSVIGKDSLTFRGIKLEETMIKFNN
jgi:hypothetical protein